VFAWSSARIAMRSWLVVGGLLVAMALVVVGTRRSPDDIDGGQVCPWIESVRTGTMPLQIRSKGTVATGGSPNVRVVVSLDAAEGALARVGQAAEMDNNTRRAQGRLIDVFKNSDNGLTSVLAEFGRDAPEKRHGSEITVTIDAGAIPNVLFVGHPAFARSHSEQALFRFDPRSGIADRVRVRYGRVVGNFAEIVDGLHEGDRVILSDMTGYERVRRIRFE
jgi:HlyD family secretion protein